MSNQKTIRMSLVAFICVSIAGFAITAGLIYSAMSLNTLEAEYESLNQQYEFTKGEVANLTGINSELSEENASLVAETERLAEENANLRLAAETNLDLGMDVDIDALLEDALNP